MGTSEQVGQLQQALTDLEKARVVLDNQIQQTADMQEKQVVDLRSTVQKQEARYARLPRQPPAPKCPAPATTTKKRAHNQAGYIGNDNEAGCGSAHYSDQAPVGFEKKSGNRSCRVLVSAGRPKWLIRSPA